LMLIHHRRYQVCGVQGLDEGADRRVERLGESSRVESSLGSVGSDDLADASLKHYGVMVSSREGAMACTSRRGVTERD
jgi:hypothetical protein